VRFRITQTVTVEYEVGQEFYPDGLTTDQMLALDIAEVRRNPDLIHAFGDTPAKIEIAGEVI
jgi:hypothetical protein